MTTLTLSMPRKALASLATIALAASKDDVTPVICALNLSWTETGEITAHATDRYMVAEAHYELGDHNITETGNILIPAQWLIKAQKSFPARAGSSQFVIMEISNDETRTITIHDYETRLTIPEIKGNFPPVARLFPETIPETVDNFNGFNINPDFITRIAKMIPPTMTARELKHMPIYMQPTTLDYGNKPAPIVITRRGQKDFRVLLQPNLNLS